MSNNITNTPSRHLNWPNCYNARDLGGLKTTDGKQTRWQTIIRTDIVNRLTETGKQAILDYGVRTTIDLRSPQEAAEQPSLFANTKEILYLNLPLETRAPHVSALISQAKTRGEVYCIILDHYPEMMATVMRAIINAPSGGIVIHCQAGKDRTGMVAALLLSLVNVPIEQVAADYAESQHRLWPLYKKIVAEAGGEENLGFWSKPTVTEEMMYHMMSHLETKHGSVAPYLLKSGLTFKEIDKLQHRLCSP